MTAKERGFRLRRSPKRAFLHELDTIRTPPFVTEDFLIRSDHYEWLQETAAAAGAEQVDMINRAINYSGITMLALKHRLQPVIKNRKGYVHEVPLPRPFDDREPVRLHSFLLLQSRSLMLNWLRADREIDNDVAADHGIRMLGALAAAGKGAELSVESMRGWVCISPGMQELKHAPPFPEKL
jgi:hypothetical protein